MLSGLRDMAMLAMVTVPVAMLTITALWYLGSRHGWMRPPHEPRTSDPRTWDLPFALAFAGFLGLLSAFARTGLDAGHSADLAVALTIAILMLVLPRVAPQRRS